MKEIFGSKKRFKHRYKKCCICSESNYEVLDVHRWRIEGANGGKYTCDNSICVCVKCHRLIHSNIISIIGVFNSTSGKIINYIDKNGKEQINLL
jgi:hypothetical protein